jgi:hypothetical protein
MSIEVYLMLSSAILWIIAVGAIGAIVALVLGLIMRMRPELILRVMLACLLWPLAVVLITCDYVSNRSKRKKL